MKDFVLLFRTSNVMETKPTQEQIDKMVSAWMTWMGDIAAQGKLVNNGSRLGFANSKVVKPNNVVTNGPYTEIKEIINGFIIIRTETIDEAVDIAKACPMVVGGGGNVEVRPAVAASDNE